MPGLFADWILALATALFPVSLMALGAAGRRRLGPAGWALGGLLAILATAAAGLLVLSGHPEAARLAGFPVAAVVQVVGLWLLPLPVATLAYALTFDRAGIAPRDLEELRARAGGGDPKASPEPPGRG